MRVTAAMTVAIVHSMLIFYGRKTDLPLPSLAYAAAIAVDLFFVLSGFLIGRILLGAASQSRQAITNFALRRLLRTLPNYLLFLVLNIIVWKWHFASLPDHMPYWLFLQNLWTPQPMFFVESWSLATEEWFYLVIAAVALIAGRHNTDARWVIALLVVVAGAMSARYALAAFYGHGWDLGVRKIVIARLDGPAYGMLTAILLTRHTLSSAKQYACFALGLTMIATSFLLNATFDLEKQPALQLWLPTLVGVGFAALLPLADRWRYRINDNINTAKVAASAGALSMLAWFADISYALYLTNLLSYRIIDWCLDWVNRGVVTPWQFAGLNLIVSVLLAALCFHAFEKPILRWRDRYFPSTKST
jgi:peptidoglycan/LPS O-acetylase OafA/YrhL